MKKSRVLMIYVKTKAKSSHLKLKHKTHTRLFEPSDLINGQSSDFVLQAKANGKKFPPKVIFKGVRQLNINKPLRMQISVFKKGWMNEEGMLYLYTVCSEKKLFMRTSNTILGIRNKVRMIVLLSRVSCY